MVKKFFVFLFLFSNIAKPQTTSLMKVLYENKEILALETIKNSQKKSFFQAIDKNGRNALHMATIKGFLKVVKALSDKIDLDEQDYWGNTPLHLACMFGHEEIVEYLLSKKTSLTRQNNKGEYPLHLSTKYLGIIDLLLRHNAKINVQDYYGYTPVRKAIFEKNTGATLLLMSRGADVTILDFLGNSTLHLAIINKLFIVVLAILATKPDTKFIMLKNTNFMTVLELAKDDAHTTLAIKKYLKTRKTSFNEISMDELIESFEHLLLIQ